MSPRKQPPTAHLQYLDLYQSQQAYIEQHSVPVLQAQRATAQAALSEYALPQLGMEDWQRTDVEALYAPDYGINFQELDLAPAGHKQLPQYSCDLSVNELTIKASALNSNYLYTHYANQKRKLPEGVFVGSIKEFVKEYPDLAERYYGQIAEVDTDGTIALNTLFVQDAFVLYVPDGMQLEQPVQLVQLLHAQEPLLCIRRWLIIIGDRAKASVLVCDHTIDRTNFLVNQVAEIYVGDGAQLKLFDMEENSHQTHRTCAYFLRQGAESQVTLAAYTLNNGVTRNSFRTRFLGEHAEQTLGGVAVTNGTQHVDTFTRVEHIHPKCHSTQLFKNLLEEQSTGAFSGRIFVAQSAQQTEAYQSNRNMLLSPEARMHSKPQLEIYADDVQCSHGMATGHLDEQALFYMMQRGIPEHEARVMLSVAFVRDVIDLMPLEELQNRIESIVRNRLLGKEPTHCSQCGKLIF